MGKKWEKLGENWGMWRIPWNARTNFFVFPLIVMQSVFPLVRLDKTFGTIDFTVKMAPSWTVFPIFPQKSLICSQANAPISLVWYWNCEKYRWLIFQQNQYQNEVTTWFITFKTLYTTHNIPYQTYAIVYAHILSFSHLMHIRQDKCNIYVHFRYFS